MFTDLVFKECLFIIPRTQDIRTLWTTQWYWIITIYRSNDDKTERMLGYLTVTVILSPGKISIRHTVPANPLTIIPDPMSLAIALSLGTSTLNVTAPLPTSWAALLLHSHASIVHQTYVTFVLCDLQNVIRNVLDAVNVSDDEDSLEISLQ